MTDRPTGAQHHTAPGSKGSQPSHPQAAGASATPPGSERALAPGYRAARPARPPQGRQAASAAVADGWSKITIGCGFALLVGVIFGVLKGALLVGLAAGAVLSGLLLANAWRSRLTLGPGWLTYSALLGHQSIALDDLRDARLRQAISGSKAHLVDGRGRAIDVKTDLLQADPAVASAVREALNASRKSGLLKQEARTLDL